MEVNITKITKYSPIIRWATVGTITASIDLFCFVAVYKYTNSVLASNFLSSLSALLFNYTSHYVWSFKNSVPHKYTGSKYLLNLLIFWTTNTVLLKVLIQGNMPPERAKFLLIFILAPFSFISLKNFVFKR